MDRLRIFGRKGEKLDRLIPSEDGQHGPAVPPKPIDGQLHVLVSRQTVTSTTTMPYSSAASTVPTVSSRVSAPRQDNRSAPRSRPRDKRDTLPAPRSRASSDTYHAPRIDEQMHVLNARPRPTPTVSPIIPAVELPARTTSSAPSAPPPQPRIRASTIPVPPAPPAFSGRSVSSSAPSSAASSESGHGMRRLRPAPIPPNAPPAIIAGCIAEVLGIQDVHGVLDYLEQRERKLSATSRETTFPQADMVPRLAIKAKGLFEDNKRMHSEIRGLKAERAELEAQLKRVQSAMENMVRVAEIMNVRSRFTPPASPLSDLSNAPTGNRSVPICTGCGSACATCSGTSAPIIDRGEIAPIRTRWSMLPSATHRDLGSMDDDDEGQGRLTILPPPRRVSRVASTDTIPLAPRPTSIHLGDADCGVSLNRFKGDDDDNSDDETEHLMSICSDVEDCSKILAIPKNDKVEPEATTVEKPNTDKPIDVKEAEAPVEVEFQDPITPTAPFFASLKSADDSKQSHRTSVMICECECDGNSLTSTTTDTPDGNCNSNCGGDLIVLKTGFDGQGRKRMSMSLDPKSQQILKVKMVTTTLVRSSSGDVSSLSSSTRSVSVETEAGPNVDEQEPDTPDISIHAEAEVPVVADKTRNEPDGYPWW